MSHGRGHKSPADPIGRTCARCEQYKPWDQFFRRRNHSTGYQSRCKSCTKDSYHDPAATRNATLIRVYGITQADYEALLEAQNGHCSLCPKRAEGEVHGVLAVDHCHETGRVRGLLCTACNIALGRLGDTPVALRRVLEYLMEHECQT